MARLLMVSLLLFTGCAATQGGLRHVDAVAPLAFPTTPAELETRCRSARDEATTRYNHIAVGEGTHPLLAYEEATSFLGEATDPLTPLAKLHPDPAMRRAAADCKERVVNAATATLMREDLYRRLEAAPADGADQQRLKNVLLNEFRDNGLGVPESQSVIFRQRAERLATMEREFSDALVDDPATISFTLEELAGVPTDLIARLPRHSNGQLLAHGSGDAATIQRTATRAETRKKALLYLDNRGNGNLKRLTEIAKLRHDQAVTLGKPSWLSVRAASQMASTPERVESFLDDMQQKLNPLITADINEFAKLKGAGTTVQPWDIPWLRSRLTETSAGVDEESLRRFFSLMKVREGLFTLAGRLFGLRFQRCDNPAAWSGDVDLYRVSEENGTTVGWLYLDLLYRPGKTDSSYEISLLPHRITHNGEQLPAVLLVSNLRPYLNGGPQLLPRQVKTLLHEFGHSLHDLLGRATYASLGTALIPWDVIETPSTLFEQLADEPAVLAILSGDALPAETAEHISRGKQIGASTRWGGTLLTARFDAKLHGPTPPDDPLRLWQCLHLEVSQLPAPPESRAPGTIGHMVTGYDGRYYGYLWSAVIASDLLGQFRQDGLLTRRAGDHLRRDVLAPGNGKPAQELLRGYLGRDFSEEPFLRGITSADTLPAR